MANNLRKYKYTDKPATSKTSGGTPSNKTSSTSEMDEQVKQQTGMMTDIKTELLLSVKAEMTKLFQTEFKSIMAEEFNGVKSELQAVRQEIASNTSALRSDLDLIRTTVSDMERGLSGCSDDITELQNTVRKLEENVQSLQEKCLDMEGRMRRSNIRLLNVAEVDGSSTPTSVSKLIKEVLKMDKDVLIDRSHRTLQVKRADGKPRAIVAKLHYYQDCVEILRLARESGPLQHKGSTILIFPDYPPSIARARSAFNEVRKLLRGWDGVHYGLLYPARLRITYKGKDKQFQDAIEAMAYVKDNIL
uniref:L1 transposable element RRM domain-containing protein n=1 Tax=Pygocentrus nattereri TaxID=42514 RepID=A0AAR2JRM7_PYGNA